jgi:hypothetical protein
MGTTITKIRENNNNKEYDVTAATVSLVNSTDGSDISVKGTVVNANPIPVTCIVTRHYRDAKDDLMAWTRTLFCQATGHNWSAKIGKLAPGKYTFVFAAEGEDIDCVKLEVAKTEAKHTSMVHTEMAIISTGKSDMAINVNGSVNNYPQTVSCSLTPIDSSGASTGPTCSRPVQAPSGTWIVGFSPIDVGQTRLSGLYSFTAWAYEGCASEPISVP